MRGAFMVLEVVLSDNGSGHEMPQTLSMGTPSVSLHLSLSCRRQFATLVQWI